MGKRYDLSETHYSTRLHEIETGYFVQEVYSSGAPSLSEAGGANLIYEYLKSGASFEMNVDGGTPVNFDFIAGKDSNISRINFSFTDANMRNDQFGGLGAVLTNGLLLNVLDTDGTTSLLDFLGGVPITKNADFANLAGVDAVTTAAVGDDALPIRFTISKSGKGLSLLTGQRIRLVVQDNISGISQFRAMVQGYQL